jgi:putative ABC transport system permease protein
VRTYLRIIFESVKMAFQALISNRLRTLLSLLGVTIGIFSIIFVLSIVDSMEADMRESLEMIGSDVLLIKKWPMGPEEGKEEYEWWKFMQRREPSLKDMQQLQSRLHLSDAISFECSSQQTAKYESNFLEGVNVNGVTYQYNQTIAVKIGDGRYFTEQECDGGRPVCIIGNTVANQLFGKNSPLGQEITVAGLKLRVIAQMKKEGASLFGSGMDQTVIVPIGYAARWMDAESSDGAIIVKAKTGTPPGDLKGEVIQNYRSIRGVKPGADSDFSIIEAQMISNVVDQIVGVFNSAGMFIGIFAILVGAFSIANIMFVSVRERTNIIGVQKALGAKNSFILIQFLTESITLCIIGGFFGLLLVYGAIAALNGAVEMNFILPISRIFMGVGISASVGIIAGFLPAYNAANLDPVEAMRGK